jgi:uncharacterized repeat protein (TIGR01451 family)
MRRPIQCLEGFSPRVDAPAGSVRLTWALLTSAVIALSSLALQARAQGLDAQTADLSLTKVVSNPTPVIGTQVTFTVTLRNGGPGAAQTVKVRDKLPNGYTFVSANVSRGSYNPSTGQWTGLNIPRQSTAQLTLVATVKQSGNRVNVAEVIASASPDPDSTPNNGNPAEDDYAQATTTPRPPNVAPVITGQQPLGMPEDTSLTVVLTNLIVTDPDNPGYPNGFTLRLLGGSNYTVTGTSTINPVANFSGGLTVPAIVNDGTSDSAPFGLTVTVAAVNDAPVITGQLDVGTTEDTALDIVFAKVLVADPDLPAYPAGFTLLVQSGTNYSVTAPGQITPAANYSGALTVPVSVSDGVVESNVFPLVVTVAPVNDVPVITGQVPVATPEDTPVTIALTQLSIDDPDDAYPDDLVLSVLPGPQYSVGEAGEITPATDFNGDLAVHVVVSDGEATSAPYDMAVSVTAVNDAPQITGQSPVSTPAETPVVISIDDIVVADPDDDEFTLSVQPGSGYAVTGPAEITPDAGITGNIAVGVSVNDGDLDSAVFPMQVAVTGGANVPPVIVDQHPLATNEDSALTIALADLTVSDPDSDPADLVLSLESGEHYTITGVNEITPSTNYYGGLVVPVRVSDGLDTSDPFDVQVGVTPVNDPPVINGQVALSTRTHTAITLTLDDLVVDDPDSDSQELALAVEPGADYTITAFDEVTPNTGFAGTMNVPVAVSDGTDVSEIYDVAIGVSEPPNIIVIMADDLDVRSLSDLLNAGLMSNVKTEIIDRAVAFDQSFVTTPLCCPSRSSFLTGEYPHNTTIMNNRLIFPGYTAPQWAVGGFDDSDTIATRLQVLGYTTGLIGKYLNGYGSDTSLTPLSPAYDPHYVPPGWSNWQVLIDFSTYCIYNYYMNSNGAIAQYPRPPGQSGDTATYQTNVLSDLSEAFVLAHRDDTAPFFLWVTPLVPHAEECPDAYEGGHVPDHVHFKHYIRPAPEFENAVVPDFVPSPSYDEDLSDKPTWMQFPPLTSEDLADVTRQYQSRLRSLLSLDLMVARIVAALGDARDNTIIVFTSDNGWFLGEHRRTEKVLAYDESGRVPLYVVLPWVAPGTRSNFVLNNDLEPTLLELASPGYGDADFDGRSLARLLTDPAPPGWTERTQFLMEFGKAPGQSEAGAIATYLAVRNRTQLYIESYSGSYQQSGTSTLSGLELYDLANDPYEMNSLLHFPQSAQDPVLGPWASRLHGCVAEACKQYENGIAPP